MAATESTMLALGTAAPAFTLPDVSTGQLRQLTELAGGRAVLVERRVQRCFDSRGRCWRRVVTVRAVEPAAYDALRASRAQSSTAFQDALIADRLLRGWVTALLCRKRLAMCC
jgi:hypothetical protein